jgi:choline dehydrogenase-like flavoprotein
MATTPIATESVEVLVIGSGPGGAITACTLAEAGHDVLVCEEGDWVEHGTLPQFSLSQMQAQYRQAGLCAALGRPPIAYAEGRCAGGGSEINSGLYHRPPDAIVAAWARDHQVADLSPESLAPHAETIEKYLGVSTSSTPVPHASSLLERGAQRLGWAVTEVPRWFKESSDPADAGRQTMTRTYLPRAIAAGAQVRTGWRATKLLFDGERVIGGRFATVVDGRTVVRDVNARSVVVSCGAVHSPALLQRSGLRGTIGKTLRMHPTVKLVAEFDHAVPFEDVPLHQVKEFGPDLSFGGSASSPGQIALALSDDWDTRREAMENADRLFVYYAAIRSQGVGRVLSLPGITDPIVSYRLTPRDLHLLAQGLGRLALLTLRAGATRVWASVRNAPVATNEAEIPEMVERLGASTASLMTVHLFSSTPMGEAERCPVDSFGRVKGTRGLFVNDASLLPTAPGVNPQGSIMALAARNVARWLDSGELDRA